MVDGTDTIPHGDRWKKLIVEDEGGLAIGEGGGGTAWPSI